MKLKIIVCILALAFAPNVRAQANPDAPEVLAKQMLEMMRKQDWAGYARFMHGEALANLKRGYGVLFSAKEAGQARRQFFNVNTQAEYERLPETEVFARLMRAMTKRAPEMNELLGSSEMFVIGSVNESPDSSHVVYRLNMKMADVPLSRIDTISFKKEDGRWRALLRSDLEAMMSAALRSAGKQPANVSR